MSTRMLRYIPKPRSHSPESRAVFANFPNRLPTVSFVSFMYLSFRSAMPNAKAVFGLLTFNLLALRGTIATQDPFFPLRPSHFTVPSSPPISRPRDRHAEVRSAAKAGLLLQLSHQPHPSVFVHDAGEMG